MTKIQKIEITYKTILRTIFTLVLLWLLFQIRETILLLFIGIIMVSALGPIVRRLEKFSIPRSVSIIVFYLLFISVVVGTFAAMIPMLVEQVSAFISNFPAFIENIGLLNFDLQISDYVSELSRIPGNVFKLINFAFSNILKILAFVVITFYLLMERQNFVKYLAPLFDKAGEKRAKRLIAKFEEKLGGWVRGQLSLMLIVGLLSWVGLRLLSIDFALPLALFAGLFEIIPNIGPTISMFPAMIIAASYSPPMVLAVVALYFLIQQVENNFIVPLVMRKATGIHPLITLLALMVGFRLGGVGGTLLSLPTLLTVKIVLEEFYPQLFDRFKSNK